MCHGFLNSLTILKGNEQVFKVFEKIDFSPGKVTYDDFDINTKLPFEEQEFSFKEDMFQVSYGDKYTLDIGWYPSHEKNGKFRIVIIRDYDWMNPLYSKRTKDLKRLYKLVRACAQIVRDLLQETT